MNKVPCKLVLGGGAARGFAHIGALDVLQEVYDIRAIIGTSMGAIVGGLYACGYSPREIHKLLDDLSARHVFSLVDFDWRLKGLVSGRNIVDWLDDVTGKIKIEDLRLDYAAIAYDMCRKRTVVINKGRLSWAMRASSSLPFIFSPFVWNDYELVDGGTEHPLPLEFGNLFYPDLPVVAVNVLPPVPQEPIMLNMGDEAELGNSKRNLVHIAFEWTANNQYYLASKSMLSAEAALTVEAHLPDLDEADFDQYERFIEAGRAAATQALQDKTPLDRIRDRVTSYLQRLRELRP